MKKPIISASILSANMAKLGEEIADVLRDGAKRIHMDVMDGHFVDNITFGAPLIKYLKLPEGSLKDIHLMIDSPLHFLDSFIDAGANIITVHIEALKDGEFNQLIYRAHRAGVLVGISLRPSTSLDAIADYLPYVDLVLVMSVEPGFGGQKFLDEALGKIRTLKKIKNEKKYKYLIEVDGGIDETTATSCVELGADVLVSGSYIFKAKNRKRAIEALGG
jgi:ribulose-phosphate 3-epimerase